MVYNQLKTYLGKHTKYVYVCLKREREREKKNMRGFKPLVLHPRPAMPPPRAHQTPAPGRGQRLEIQQRHEARGAHRPPLRGQKRPGAVVAFASSPCGVGERRPTCFFLLFFYFFLGMGIKMKAPGIGQVVLGSIF